MNRCPHCGGSLRPRRRTMQSTHRSPLKNDVAVLPMPATERQITSYLPTKESNVIVPFYRAVITGGFASLIGGTIGGYAAIATGGGFGLVVTWGLGAGLGSFIIVANWKWISDSKFYDSLLWNIETVTGLDLDRDGEVGEPEPPPRVEVEVRHERHPWQLDTLNVEPAALRHLAELVIDLGESFSERTASKTPITQPQFSEMRQTFLKHGWAQWRNEAEHRQGVRLTAGGRGILEMARRPNLHDI